jgi:predicted amidohydrolase
MFPTATSLRIAAAQTCEFIEDVQAALDCLIDVMERATTKGAVLLCLPEGFLQGYLTDEQTARKHAVDLGSLAFDAVLQRLPLTAPMTVFGLIEVDKGRLFNTAVVVYRRTLVGRYRKTHLLGRERWFDAGHTPAVFEVEGLRFGINICYDTNFPSAAKAAADLGASLILCPANNMLPRKAAEEWMHAHDAIRGERCRETGLWLMSSDITGQRNGCVSWGPTAVLAPTGQVAAQLPLGPPGLLLFDLPIN